MKKLFPLIILLLVVACGTSSDKSSILDKSSCNLPCWNGIVPGQTTESELLKILGSLSDVNQASIQNDNRPWNIFDNQIFFSFRQGWTLSQRPKLRGEVSITNNTVSDLILCGEIKTSMGQLVEEVGEPGNILSGDDITGSRTVILINSQIGLSYWYTANPNNLEISQGTQIDCLGIFDPSLYENMLDAKLLSGGYYNAEETLKVWYPWDGYGNLDEKYPPRQP